MNAKHTLGNWEATDEMKTRSGNCRIVDFGEGADAEEQDVRQPVGRLDADRINAHFQIAFRFHQEGGVAALGHPGGGRHGRECSGQSGENAGAFAQVLPGDCQSKWTALLRAAGLQLIDHRRRGGQRERCGDGEQREDQGMTETHGRHSLRPACPGPR